MVTRVAGDLEPDPRWEKERFVFARKFRLRNNQTFIFALVLIHNPRPACPFEVVASFLNPEWLAELEELMCVNEGNWVFALDSDRTLGRALNGEGGALVDQTHPDGDGGAGAQVSLDQRESAGRGIPE